jgi:hypothetical protein
MSRRIIYSILILLLIADLSYSFVQHLSMPLDGDMAGGIVPANDVKPILADPFGISVIKDNAVYPNPNRFFAHWTFYNYFKYTPILLQSFVDPIDSVYLTCAIAKIIIQISLIILLAFYIIGHQKIISKDFVLASILIVPLFQTNGYRSYMGIIDPCTSYTFFYALPCALLLLFYLPFFRTSFYNREFTKNIFALSLLMVLCVFITLNGPLDPGIILTISLLYILKQWIHNFSSNDSKSLFQRVVNPLRKIPKPHFFFFLLISIVSIYSLYIGRNNSIFWSDSLSLFERYLRIPMGLYYIITQKIGFPFLLLLISINLFIFIRYFKNSEARKIINLFKWIGLFSFLYILFLPLGGYKNYRPYIIRYDTFMPITIGLIFLYGISTFYLIRNIKGKLKKNLYILLVFVFCLIYTVADKPEFNKNDCEKIVLKEISQSKDTIVLIGNNCNLLSWKKITDPKESKLNGQLLANWRITKDKKMYYQK